MVFSKPFPYNDLTLDLDPVVINSLARYGGSGDAVALAYGKAEIEAGSPWQGILKLTQSLVNNSKQLQVTVSFARKITPDEFVTLILQKKPVPITVTLFPAAPVPAMGVPVPVAGDKVENSVLITVPPAKPAALILQTEYEGMGPGGELRGSVQAKLKFAPYLDLPDDRKKSYCDGIAIDATGSPDVTPEGPGTTEGEWRERVFIARPKGGALKEVRATAHAAVTVMGVPLEISRPLTFSPQATYLLVYKPGSLEITRKQPGSISAEVFLEVPDGDPLPVPGAKISVIVPPSSEQFLTVSPKSATGTLRSTVRQSEIAKKETVVLTLTASVGDEEIPDRPEITVHPETEEGVYGLEIGDPVPKKITWKQNAWVCDPIPVRLYSEQQGKREYLVLQNEGLFIEDSLGWLEIEKIEAGQNKAASIVPRVKKDRINEIKPPESGSKQPDFIAGRPPERVDFPEVAPDAMMAEGLLKERRTPLSTSVTIRYRPSRQVVSADNKNPVPEVKGEVIFEVDPPQLSWSIEQESPIRLSGQGKPEKIRIFSTIPDGWERDLEVYCSLPEKCEEEIGLKVTDANEKPRGLTGGTEPAGPNPGASLPNFKTLTAELTITSSFPCFSTLSEQVEQFPISIVSTSDFIGRSIDEPFFSIIPQYIAIHLGPWFAENYPWDKQPVRVIRRKRQKRTRNGMDGLWEDDAGRDRWSIPERSKINISLGTPKGWDIPRVLWKMGEPAKEQEFDLIDGFTDAKGYGISPESGVPKTMYRAPDQEDWDLKDKPTERSFYCLVGSSQEDLDQGKEVEIEIENPKVKFRLPLYRVSLLKSVIHLKEPLPVAVIKLTISPKDLPLKLDYFNPKVAESFRRDVFVEIDLEKVPTKKPGTVKQ
jgi:hypothetical protein